jgi:hypothetical protein
MTQTGMVWSIRQERGSRLATMRIVCDEMIRALERLPTPDCTLDFYINNQRLRARDG